MFGKFSKHKVVLVLTLSYICRCCENRVCICRNTAGRLMKRKKNPSDRSVGRAIVDQMALFRRAPGPSFVPRS